MPIHKIITSDSIGEAKPPVCDKCRERTGGVYVVDQNHKLICPNCQTGEPLFRKVEDAETP